jgi:hypothetical protein
VIKYTTSLSVDEGDIADTHVTSKVKL